MIQSYMDEGSESDHNTQRINEGQDAHRTMGDIIGIDAMSLPIKIDPLVEAFNTMR